jgi:hypothetical protein
VLDKEGHVEADKKNPEVDVTQRFVQHLAGELWPPEVEPSEHGEHHGAKDHVVEVGHHEVGVRDVEGPAAVMPKSHRSGHQTQKEIRNPRANTSGVSNVTDPRHIVPIQLNIFTPVGTAISIVISAKKGNSTDPVTYMWCAHTVIDSAAIAIVA